ncbi:MAG: type III PLP-dependent enzyme, partial [Candidatus Competibacterales bacterium]
MDPTVTTATPRVVHYYRALAETHGTPLFLVDCAVARRQVRRLRQALPGVGLFYAIKALPCGELLDSLAAVGAGFDIASSGEIDLLRDRGIGAMGTIHTHPVKRDIDIRTALRFGCTTFVVDNSDELAKFRRYGQRVGLLLRLAISSRDAAVDLSKKFGCAPGEALELLLQAKAWGLTVKGLSFHVGSQCRSSTGHVAALDCCHQLIQRARALGVG